MMPAVPPPIAEEIQESRRLIQEARDLIQEARDTLAEVKPHPRSDRRRGPSPSRPT